MTTATPSPTGREPAARFPIVFPARALVVAAALATLLASCKATPFGGAAAPTAGLEPRGTPEPPPTAAVYDAPPSDPLGLPTPPPGSRTSDNGARHARPTPIGQLAPEEPPAVTPR
jgi:hypothetical protein